jgi:glycosyltransferase involved in cell wall biosynthesis
MIYFVNDTPCIESKGGNFVSKLSKHEIKEIFPDITLSTRREMIKFSQKIIKETKRNDVIVCWYDFMAIYMWWLCKITFRRRKIGAYEILLKKKSKKTLKDKIIAFFYRRALNSVNVRYSVTTKEYGDLISDYLKLTTPYLIIPEVYHESYFFDHCIKETENSCFCGGNNARDWPLIIKVAKLMPNVTFNLIMNESSFKKYSSIVSSVGNINLLHNVSYDKFMEVLCSSKLVAIPLTTDAPAGLIVLLRAAANNKMVIATDTVSTRFYLGNGRGELLGKEINQWKAAISHCLNDGKYRACCASNFQSFLKINCSERIFVDDIDDMIEKLLDKGEQ